MSSRVSHGSKFHSEFRQQRKKGFSVFECCLGLLTLVPIVLLIVALSHPGGYKSPNTSSAAPPAAPLAASQRYVNENPPASVTDNVPVQLNADTFFNGSSAWERKRKMIGSEPISGKWLNDCPAVPPPNYPEEYPIMDIINNWNPDDAEAPARHFHALCRFDYQKDLEKAFAYREAELPFLIYNAPAAEEVVNKWNQPDYLENWLGNEKYRTEVSHNNHFMYFSGSAPRGKGQKAWRPPTSVDKMSFKKFKDAAVRCDMQNCSEDEEHYYFRVTASSPNHFVFKELPFFKPKKSIFIKDPKGQRGIHCRFGMREVIAENHYDGSRNVIGLFGGRRRYILSHPKECGNMYLLPMGHPSGRHSGDACNYNPDCKDSANSVDYSKPDLNKFPKFRNLKANEVILSAGDFLYLPTHWFHYIISMGLNYQCNTRSGRSGEYSKYMKKCGFK